MSTLMATAGFERGNNIKAVLKRGISEGSAVLFTGRTSDTFVYEEHRMQLDYIISCFSASLGMPTIAYSLDQNLRDMKFPNAPQAHLPIDIAASTPATVVIDRVSEAMTASNRPHTFLLDFVESLIHADNLTLDQERIIQQIARLVLSGSWREQQHLIVVISRNRAVNEAFSKMSGVICSEISLPDEPERAEQGRIMSESKTHPLVLGKGFSLEEFGRITGGMDGDAMSRMRYSTNAEHPLHRDEVLRLRAEIVSQQSGGVLEIQNEHRSLSEDVAGSDQLRLYVNNLHKEGKHTARILLLGPPGTGKSYSAPAVARALGALLVSLAQIKSMWVGESERQFREAIRMIDNNRPCCVKLDEFDQLFGGSRTGDTSAVDSSSVDASLRGMLLQWIEDVGQDNGISIIAMSNNAKGVDPAFRSRLTTIPILETTRGIDKANVAMIGLRGRGVKGNLDGITRAFNESPRNFLNRDIVWMLGAAIRAAKENNSGVVGFLEMKAAINNVLDAFGPEEELMSLSAVYFTKLKEYLPWVANPDVPAPDYLLPFIFTDGSVDKTGIKARINELHSMGY